MACPMPTDLPACRLGHDLQFGIPAPGAGSVPTSAESRAVPGEGRPLLTVISCPDCGVPAEITERFSLPSTDGPLKHVALSCAAGHHFRMAVDRLPAQAQEQL